MSAFANLQRPIFLAGPSRYKDEIGGTVLLIEDLLKEGGEHLAFVDTNAKNYRHPILMVLAFSFTALTALFKGGELAIHGSSKDFKYLGLIAWVLSYLGLKYHTRKFAGDFDVFYQKLPTYWRWSVKRFLIRSRVNFFETKYLVEYFSKYNKQTLWFPNYRSFSGHVTSEHFQNRFVFVGHVKKEKGIDRLLSLSSHLPNGWVIDIYGPLIDYKEGDFNANVVYRGELNSSNVCDVLSRYSALILLSYREGYPGVIIEAYSVGLPTIVSDLPSLNEIVDFNSGIILPDVAPPKCIEAMYEVSRRYREMRSAAGRKFQEFDREIVLNRYINAISAKC